MGSGTFGYNNSAYGDNGWNDGALFSEDGIAANAVLGNEVASGSAQIDQVGLNNFRLSIANLAENITGTASVNSITGIAGTASDGTVKLWSLINTTSGGTETWTTGTAN
tara:strand:- start:783 stop:1109 length:327 start_codon:yes stop_codon:yes gene_type:complete